MRIGIVTYWDSDDNYGQVLQCYALQKFFKDRGHAPFLIKYRPEEEKIPLKYRIESIKNIGHLVDSIYRRIFRRGENKEIEAVRVANITLNKERHFDDFKNCHIEMSKEVYSSIDDLRNNPPMADVYVTGSDQVWHDSLYLPNVAGWYLQFGASEIKRYSYAVSMGRSLQKSEEKIFVDYLRKFNCISVREKGVQEICSRLGFKSDIVIDPTMLLDAESYRDLEQSMAIEKPYSLIYSINVDTKEDIFGEELLKCIRERKEGLIFVSSSGYIPAHKLFEDIPIFFATIPQWLFLIEHASTIYTTSFHGVVFSILYNKSFYWIPLKGRASKGNGRIIDLLEKLNLSDRILEHSETLAADEDRNIDWNEVSDRLRALRGSSINYIEKILGGTQ